MVEMKEQIVSLLKGVDHGMRNPLMKGTVLLVSFLVMLVALGTSAGLAQEQMSWEEYEATLLSWQQREMDAKAAIAEEEANIDRIKTEIATIDQRIADITMQMYELLGITQADVDQLDREMAAILDHIDQLKMMSSQDLEFKRDEIDGIEMDIDQLKKWPAAGLPAMQRKMADLRKALMELRGKLPRLPRTHTVVKGECLYVISGYPQIYDDPLKWPRIYRANRDQIKDPNLIYPGWVLDIPRGFPSTHTVVEGEYLSKIASYWEIYNDARQWPRIYRANQDQIKDPDLIFPDQVLSIPRD
jgi:nucleoid-associated protein YgaU